MNSASVAQSSAASELRTSSVAIGVLTDLLLDSGLAVEAIAQRCGASVDSLRDRETPALELSAFVALWELAADVTRDPAIGLHLIDRYQAGQMHFVSQVMRHSGNARECAEQWRRYASLVSPADRVDVETEGRYVLIRYTNLSAIHQNRFIPEHYTTAGLRRASLFCGMRLRPTEVRCLYPDPGYRDEYARVFQAPVHFQCSETAVVLDRKDFERRFITADAYMRRQLSDYADLLLLRSQDRPQSVRAEVEQLLTELLPRGLGRKEEVAARMGLAPHTLHRRLRGEGLVFRTVLEEVRRDLAIAYLRQDISIGEIAFLLGFAEPAPFVHAFKKWFGVSPGAYRKESRNSAERRAGF